MLIEEACSKQVRNWTDFILTKPSQISKHLEEQLVVNWENSVSPDTAPCSMPVCIYKERQFLGVFPCHSRLISLQVRLLLSHDSWGVTLSLLRIWTHFLQILPHFHMDLNCRKGREVELQLLRRMASSGGLTRGIEAKGMASFCLSFVFPCPSLLKVEMTVDGRASSLSVPGEPNNSPLKEISSSMKTVLPKKNANLGLTEWFFG